MTGPAPDPATRPAMTDPHALPDPNRPLQQRSWHELGELARRLRRRTTLTPLERIAQEVGEPLYAMMMDELAETTVVMSRRRAIGLSPYLYLALLRHACQRRMPQTAFDRPDRHDRPARQRDTLP